MSDEPNFDECGRGPLAREFQRRCGFDIERPAAGFAAFAKSIERARVTDKEFPEEFRAMLAASVDAIVTPILEAQQETIRQRVEEIVNERLEPVRKAFAELRAEMAAMKASAGKPASSRVQSPRLAVPVGK